MAERLCEVGTGFLDYLKTENQGLEHSLIQEALAAGLCERGEWVKAKPYAVAAGQTYSARGLSVASYVCEGLGHWQESERWIRSRTESYPSSSGLSWYLWCCRTGRGDQEAALKFAEPYVARLATSNSEERQVDVGVFYLLQGDPERARDAFAKALKIKFSYPVAIMLVQLSVALEDTETFDRTLVLIDQAAEAYKQLPGYKEAPHATMRAIVELIKAEEASPERMADIEAKLLAFHNSRSRTACCYFVATELSARGHEEEAVKYWRRALNPYDRDIDYATLAGFELATRYGTSRPEEDMLDKSTQWPPLDEE